MHENLPDATPGKRLKLVGAIALAAAVAVAAAGIWHRIDHERDLKSEVESRHIPVKVIHAALGPGEQTLTLPGDVRADYDAPIYARVNGYLKNWYTDIGARVKKGQLLGEIETPELDQAIARAREDVATAESNFEIAEITAKRWQNLLVTDSVSHQETDEKVADARSKHDILNAANARLRELLAEQAFNKVVAPFDGVVTERNTDIGKLINIGSSSAPPLFRVMSVQKLRVYVEVPQNYSTLIKAGMQVAVDFPERPTQHFTATVMDLSNSINESARTLMVELWMDNKDGLLLPGSYAEVHFDLSTPVKAYQLSASALLFRKDGLEVATVGPGNRVVLKPVAISRDFGRTVEIASGVTDADRIIDTPSDSIVQGEEVQVVNDQSAAPSAGNKP